VVLMIATPYLLAGGLAYWLYRRRGRKEEE